MPRTPARIRKRFIEGETEVLDWEIEETLVHGVPLVFGPPCRFKTHDEWAREWNRYREIVLPKVIEYCPGSRPFAMYATGEIPPRELAMQLPQPNGWWTVDVRGANGSLTTHYLNVPEPWMRSEAKHLHRLGVIDDDELRRHREWVKRGKFDTYPLEMSLYQ